MDYSNLNRRVKAECYPIPEIEEIFDELQGSNVFSRLKFFSGCWKIKISDDLKDVTAFVTCYGTFRFEVMLFGLINAPATFKRMMNGIFAASRFSVFI